MPIIVAAVGAAAAVVLAFVGVVFFIVAWPAFWLSFLAYRIWGTRTAAAVGLVTLAGSLTLLGLTEGNGPGPIWSLAYFFVPPIVARDYSRQARFLSAKVSHAAMSVRIWAAPFVGWTVLQVHNARKVASSHVASWQTAKATRDRRNAYTPAHRRAIAK